MVSSDVVAMVRPKEAAGCNVGCCNFGACRVIRGTAGQAECMQK